MNVGLTWASEEVAWEQGERVSRGESLGQLEGRDQGVLPSCWRRVATGFMHLVTMDPSEVKDLASSRTQTADYLQIEWITWQTDASGWSGLQNLGEIQVLEFVMV